MLPIRDRLPTRRLPVVNYLIIATNVLVFFWERAIVAGEYPMRRLLLGEGLVPAHLVHAPLASAPTILSSMFMHAGWQHIAGNMLFLWIFGDNVEDAMGHARYLGFYLLCGVAAALGQVLVDPMSHVPMVGASGAIAGILAAYGSLYPRSPVTVVNPVPLLWLFFGILLEVPAWLVILEFFVVNLVYGYGLVDQSSASGVAFFAHIGGFLAGLFLVRLFLPKAVERGYRRWDGFLPSSRRVRSRRVYYTGDDSLRRPWGG